MGKTSALHSYVLALGSNRAQSAALTPPRLLDRAATLISRLGEVRAVSPLVTSPPLGPSLRHYSNGALLVESPLRPHEMLRELQGIERQLGRQRHRRWGARRMDIDIIFWSGGCWQTRALHIPHPSFRTRAFVLSPLCSIIPDWRDPVSLLTVRQLQARLRKAVPRSRARG